MTEEELQVFWENVKEEVKRRRVDLAMWGALEACVPVAVEEERLILGLASEDYHRRGHLTTVLARRSVEEVMRELGGEMTGFDVIPGTTVEEWGEEKEREEVRRKATGEASQRRREEGGIAERWNALSEELVRKHSATRQKNYPQVMAAFLLECLEEILRFENELGEEAKSDLSERNLARVLHKLSVYTSIPAAAVGLEYIRAKHHKQGGQ